MPSKKSKSLSSKAKASSRSSLARTFSEEELPQLARELIGEANRILLEGPLGVGKTTLVTHLLRELGVEKGAEGSPSFPIAHEYRTLAGRRILHVDFYRLKSEVELEQTGLLEELWDPEVIIIAEWSSLFPEVVAALDRDFSVLHLSLDFEGQDRRKLRLR